MVYGLRYNDIFCRYCIAFHRRCICVLVSLCVLLSLSDFNMFDCTVFCDMLMALVALCHLFKIVFGVEPRGNSTCVSMRVNRFYAGHLCPVCICLMSYFHCFCPILNTFRKLQRFTLCWIMDTNFYHHHPLHHRTTV